MIRDAQGDAVLQEPGPALTADKDEVVYELAFDLPDSGLGVVAGSDDTSDIGSDRRDNISTVVMGADDDTAGRRYPTRTRRSVVGNQPYDTYAPRMTFLQLGVVRAHRSVLEANRLARMTKEERLLAATTTALKPFIDNVMH